MINIEQIQEKIKEAIKQSGMTQTKIAKLIGVKQQTINCYLSGKANPGLDTFANLCAVLDLDSEDILCIKDFNKNNESKIEIHNSFNNNSGNINFRG